MLYCPAGTTPLHSGMTMLSVCTAYNTTQCYAKLYYNITYNSIALCCMVYSYWHHTIAKQFVYVSNSISSTETLHIHGGWFINGSLIYNTQDMCYDMQPHSICVYETRDILHNTWHLQHHMTYNTWYLYAHRCTHLLRIYCLAINTVQYLYLSVYICISLYMCTTF